MEGKNNSFYLRPYKYGDAEKIVTWCNQEDIYFKWSGGRFGTWPITAQNIDSKYREQNGDCKEADNFYPMCAVDGEELVGQLIMRYTEGNHKHIRFGWVILDPEKRGCGYGKKMLQLALKYAFEILGAEQVTIGVYENNLPAQYCYAAAGFRKNEQVAGGSDTVKGEEWKLLELIITEEEYRG